jgi:hypothetical protein
MISKKAPAFLGTPPGEGGGGRARASAGEGDHPNCTPLERSGMAEVWGYPCARERSDEPLRCRGQQPPLKATPEGWPEIGPLLRFVQPLQAFL